MVNDAITAGASAIVRGGPCKDEPLSRGAFYRPTLLEVNDSQMAIVQQEILAPFSQCSSSRIRRKRLRWRTTRSTGLALASGRAISIAPSVSPWSVKLGLSGSTTGGVMFDQFEEGGFKQSGQGRMRGLAVLDDFLEYKHIELQPG